MSVSLSPCPPCLAEDFDTAGFDVAAFTTSALRDWQSLAATLDHTLLKPSATSNDVLQLCEEAGRYHFACVMVNPCWIALAHSALDGTGVPVGSVVGFPLGASLTRSKREEGESALRLGARELDMVINIGKALGGDWDYVEAEIRVSGCWVASVQLGDASSETTSLPVATRSGFTT